MRTSVSAAQTAGTPFASDLSENAGDAWGRDELHPISHRGDGGFDMGLTIIDGLDTAILMGLQTEVADAR
jgi:hypothetical protein